MSPSERRIAWRLAALALWLALALVLGRALIVYAMDALARGHDPLAVLWRVEARLPVAVAVALPFGLAMALLLGTGLLPRAAGIPLAALLAALYWSGLGHDDPYHVPDPTSDRGRVALGALVVAGAVLSLAAGLLARRLPERRRMLFGALVALLATPLVLESLLAGDDEELRLERVMADLARREDLWTGRRGDPRPGVLTPVLDFRHEGGDRPAIVLRPPASVTLRIPDGDALGAAGLGLRLAAGAHHTTGGEGPLQVRFRVARGEDVLFESTRSFGPDVPGSEREWLRIGDADGIAVRPGELVELSTELVAGSLAPGDLPGFGGCLLVRTERRPRARSTPEAPSLLLVVMDTLRADRTSLHGYPRRTTPVLDALAARGTAFLEARATSSWTWPSTASLLTGLEPPAHGVTSIESCTLAHELTTLAERLQERGYTTAGFSANPLVSADRGFDQGFEHFQSARARFESSAVLVPDVLAWLERNAGRRFFLYVHLVDPHEPHRPLPRHESALTDGRPADLPEDALTLYRERRLRLDDPSSAPVPAQHARWLDQVYDACVASGDTWFGELLDALADLGLGDRTVVAFTSDHGEELLDHGHLGHGHSLHRELVHVPLVLAGPSVPAGLRVARPVSNRHLAPTLARLGGAVLEGLHDARDLLGAPTGDEDAEPGLLLSTRTGWHAGRGKQDLVGWQRGEQVVHGLLGPGGELELLGAYDLARDPLERDPAGLDPALAGSLLVRARDHLEQLAARAPEARAGGTGTSELLRGIGYLGDDDGREAGR